MISIHQITQFLKLGFPTGYQMILPLVEWQDWKKHINVFMWPNSWPIHGESVQYVKQLLIFTVLLSQTNTLYSIFSFPLYHYSIYKWKSDGSKIFIIDISCLSLNKYFTSKCLTFCVWDMICFARLVEIKAWMNVDIPNMLAINTLRPRQNGRHFPDDIFKCIFLFENVWIWIKISLKFVPMVRINNIPALVQIMVWRRIGDKPSSEPMMVNLLTHIG